MEITEIGNWLRSTILGIIILGAVGSIFAVLILKLLSKLSRSLITLFTHILPAQARRIRNWIQAHKTKIIAGYGREFGRTGGEVRVIVAYFAFHLSRAVAWLISFNVCIFLAATIILYRRSLPLTVSTFILVVLAMLSLYRAFYYLIAIKYAYRNLPIIIDYSPEELQKMIGKIDKFLKSNSAIEEDEEIPKDTA